MLGLWEQDLRDTCGFVGSQPWWDFSLDNTVETFPRSPLFDPVTGIGGKFLQNGNLSGVKLTIKQGNGPWVENVTSILVSDPTIFLPDRTGGGK